MDISLLSRLVEVSGSATSSSTKDPRLFDASYDKARVVGKGSFGTAYLVRRKNHKSKYVAKEMLYYDDESGMFTKKLADVAANEIRVLSRVSHPNLVRYVECFEESDRMILIMEYAGRDLAQVIKRRKSAGKEPFDEAVVLSWLVQILMGLKYLHSVNILHRDCGTKNIYVSSDWTHVKLGDFGLAKAMSTSSAGRAEAHTVCGTPMNFSPELVQSDVYSSKADCWACGVVLYELMTLAHPFAAPGRLQLFENIVRAAPKPPNPNGRYSPELEDIVRGLLTADPQRRLSADQVLALPIVRRFFSDSAPTPPHSPSVPPTGAKFATLPPIAGIVSDESDVDRAASPSNAPMRRREVARGLIAMDAPVMARPDLDEWITRTFEDSAKRKRIRSLLSASLASTSLLDQCAQFDALLVELGSAVTPAVHMTLMALIFTSAG